MFFSSRPLFLCGCCCHVVDADRRQAIRKRARTHHTRLVDTRSQKLFSTHQFNGNMNMSGKGWWRDKQLARHSSQPEKPLDRPSVPTDIHVDVDDDDVHIHNLIVCKSLCKNDGSNTHTTHTLPLTQIYSLHQTQPSTIRSMHIAYIYKYIGIGTPNSSSQQNTSPSHCCCRRTWTKHSCVVRTSKTSFCASCLRI